MKKSFNISHNFFFYVTLAFLFLINISMAGCHVLLSILILGLIIHIIVKREIPPVPGFFKYFLLYILFTMVSTIFGLNPLNSIKDNKELFIFLLIPVFMLVINSRKRLETTLWIILGTTVYQALYGIVKTIIHWQIDTHFRLTGMASHWMTYSGQLMLVFIFFSVYFVFQKQKTKKWIIIGTLPFILIAIAFSLTRSAWMAVFVAVTLFVIIYKPKILWGLIPFTLIAILVMPGSVKSRMFSIFDLHDETNRDRLYMVYTGVKIFKTKPITGVGANNIAGIYARYKHPDDNKLQGHLHNNILQILAERGILSVLALLMAFLWILIDLFRKQRTLTGHQKGLVLGVLFAFIGFLVMGIFEYNFGDSEIKFILFYMLVLPYLLIPYSPTESPGNTEETHS